MLEILKAILYGIVEGVTEWLPISSTGHLILLEKLMPFTGMSENFFDMFDVVIQLGAILAVVVLFWNKVWPFAFTAKSRAKNPGNIPWLRMDIMTMWFKILVSCVPAAIIGVLFDDVLNALFYRYEVVALALIIFGIAFIIIENWNKGRAPRINTLAEITYQTALLIGVFQVIAAVFLAPPAPAPPSWARCLSVCPAPWRRNILFPGGAGDVRRQPAETGEIRLSFYNHGTGRAAGRMYRGFCGFGLCAAFPVKLYQKARFQSIWLVPHSAGHCGAGGLQPHGCRRIWNLRC